MGPLWGPSFSTFGLRANSMPLFFGGGRVGILSPRFQPGCLAFVYSAVSRVIYYLSRWCLVPLDVRKSFIAML